MPSLIWLVSQVKNNFTSNLKVDLDTSFFDLPEAVVLIFLLILTNTSPGFWITSG